MKQPVLIARFAFLGIATVLIGCGNESQVDTASPHNTKVDPTIQAAFLDSDPGGAVTVLEARKSPEPGQPITIQGRVAGAKAPFSDEFATLVLADDTLMTCERMPDDHCETPWDACCVESSKIAASRLLVQIVGPDGRPMSQSLKGVNGLAELDDLVVKGTVAEGSNADNLIVNASGIYRKQS